MQEQISFLGDLILTFTADFYSYHLAMPKGPPKKQRRDRLIRFVARRAEFAAWSMLASARDQTLSAWIRDLCNAELAKKSTTARSTTT